jgi:hypothetical protein
LFFSMLDMIVVRSLVLLNQSQTWWDENPSRRDNHFIRNWLCTLSFPTCLGGPKLPCELHDPAQPEEPRLPDRRERRKGEKKKMWQVQTIYLFKPSEGCMPVLCGIILFMV